MSLHLILGSPGTGKSTRLRTGLIQHAAEHPHQRHILLVPEQFTMQTQRDLVETHPNHAVMNIEIMSFERLAYRLLGDSLARMNILTETGKNMLLRQAAGTAEEEIRLFRRSLKKGGFISRLMSMISELLQYGITEEQLSVLESELSGHPLLARKVQELRVFLHAFLQQRGPETRVPEELLPMLLAYLKKEKALSGWVIAMDHFTGFTPVQRQILQEMLKQAESVTAVFLLPQREDASPEIREGELFYMSRMACAQLVRMAAEVHAPVTREYLEKSYRFTGRPDLAFLASRYLRYGGKDVYEGVPERVHVSMLRSPRQEAEWTARRIARLLREGVRCRQIAVVAGDLDLYRPLLQKAFADAGVPVYMDRKKGILGNPVVEYLRAALRVPEQQFSYESIFTFLRCGLSDMTREEIDALDLYVSAAGIRGKRRWQETWERIPDPRRPADLNLVNACREKVLDELAPVLALSGKTAYTISDYVQALLAMMEAGELPQKAEALKELCKESGDFVRAEENERVCEYLTGFLGQLDALLGKENVSRSEFLEILDAGLAEAKLGMLPAGLDLVQVGDLRRSRLTEVKALFVLGMNEGVIPGKAASGGILSEWERALLRDHAVELAPTAEETAGEDRFYLYMLMTRPSEHLYLTLSRMDGSGAALRPSYLLDQLLRLFPALSMQDLTQEEEDVRDLSGADDAWRMAAAGMQGLGEAVLATGKGKQEPEKYAMLSLYRELAAADTSGRMELLLHEAFPAYEGTVLSGTTASLLYGKELTGSISRLECFAACEARHFFQYALGLSERRGADFSPAERGSFFHRIMELFLQACNRRGADITALKEEEREEILREVLLQASGEDRIRQMAGDSAYGKYQYGRYERLAARAIWAICAQLSEGDFEPLYAEWMFSGWTTPSLNVELSEETRMVLNGVADRVDVCRQGEESYYRVMDFKTSNKKWDFSEIIEGLSLQLILYLEAVLAAEGKKHGREHVHPGGVFYYPLREEQIDASDDWEEETEQEKLLALWRPNGLASDASALDGRQGPAKGSKASEEQFALLGSYVREKIHGYGEQLRQGNISARPYRRKDKTACDYCPYRSTCGFDPRREGYRYRRIREWKEKDAWEKLAEAGNTKSLEESNVKSYEESTVKRREDGVVNSREGGKEERP